MPVERLPAASWPSAFGLGFLSSVFDNIPLTALALKQGGYDWGMLAYAVGFGGSMIWFGSSAGVAISNMYPEAKSVGRWVLNGWHVAVAYVIGFMVMLAVTGWNPTPKRGPPVQTPRDCSAGRGVSREVKPSRMDVQLHLAHTEIIVIVCLILMYIWPGMTLWLPNFLYGG